MFLPDLAASLNNQSVFLSDLGWREEVMAAIEEAVTVLVLAPCPALPPREPAAP